MCDHSSSQFRPLPFPYHLPFLPSSSLPFQSSTRSRRSAVACAYKLQWVLSIPFFSSPSLLFSLSVFFFLWYSSPPPSPLLLLLTFHCPSPFLTQVRATSQPFMQTPGRSRGGRGDRGGTTPTLPLHLSSIYSHSEAAHSKTRQETVNWSRRGREGPDYPSNVSSLFPLLLLLLLTIL